MQTIEVKLERGMCPVHMFGNTDDRTSPIVLLFMDAFGPRPTLQRVATAIAEGGYRVLMPDLFYARIPYRPLDAQALFSGGEEMARLMTLLEGLDQPVFDADVGGWIALCRDLTDGEARIGAAGYCMGGRYALTAASLAPEVRAAASFHGSTLAPEHGPSAHTRLAGTNARIYIGIADIDPTFDAAEEGRLAQALREARTDHMIESYPDGPHGFVMDDLPSYHAASAERHRRRLQLLLAETLR